MLRSIQTGKTEPVCMEGSFYLFNKKLLPISHKIKSFLYYFNIYDYYGYNGIILL